MIERFQGAEGRRRLISALRDQRIVRDDEGLATLLAEVAQLREVNPDEPDDILTTQGAEDNDIFFILCGAISVIVNGRELSQRVTGFHIGEMALIDEKATRAATLRPAEKSVIAIVSEEDFTRIAQSRPELWRRLALELAQRLRERNKYVKPPNLVPEIFIGCSVERLEIARQIQSGIEHDAIVTVWTDGVFEASSTAVEDLLAQVAHSDFAALIVAAEDIIISRDGVENPAPRDNVIFELGLFMGELGRARSFIVKERRSKTKIPSDLLGLTPIEYSAGEARTLPSRIAPVCNAIRRRVKELGPK
jgi:predicted nucleotide-binding protein